MNHIFYDVQVDVIPQELHPSTTSGDLLNFKPKGQQSSRESETIERYNKLTRENTFDKMDRTSHLDIFSQQQQSLSPTGPKVMETTHIPTITAIPAQEQESTSYQSPPELNAGAGLNGVADFTARQAMLERMSGATGQAVDVCHFYLEMVEWDYDSAVQMFGSLAQGS